MISINEKLYRAILVREWIDFESKKITSSAFIPKLNDAGEPKEYISVDRCHYRILEEIIEFQRLYFIRRGYFGSGELKVSDILELDLLVEYFPSKRNVFHSGIYSNIEDKILDLLYASDLSEITSFIECL